jgi:hypothetical protein
LCTNALRIWLISLRRPGRHRRAHRQVPLARQGPQQLDALLPQLSALLPPVTATMRTTRELMLSTYATMNALQAQMSSLNDTAIIMGQSFDQAKNGDLL